MNGKRPDWLAKARTRLWYKADAVKLPLVPKLIATFLFVGYSPVASGTVGSAVAAFLFYLVPALQGVLILTLATMLLLLAGIWASNVIERYVTKHDPSFIVADEVVGQWIALMPIFFRPTPGYILIAFIAFRFFDIVKLYPATIFERREDGVGVMMDDAVAGLYAFAATNLIAFILGLERL